MKTLYDLVDNIYESIANNITRSGCINEDLCTIRSRDGIMLTVVNDIISYGEFKYDGRTDTKMNGNKTIYVLSYTINGETAYKDILNKIKSLLELSSDDNIFKAKAPLMRSAYALSREVRLAKRETYTEWIENV